MKRKSTLTDYLTKPNEPEIALRLVQAKIPKELFDTFRPILKRRKCTLKNFIEAAIQKFIDENSKARVG